MSIETAKRPRFPQYVNKLEDYLIALDAHDWNYHEHLRQAGLQPERERYLIMLFEAGQRQRIQLLHSTRYFDKNYKLFNAKQQEHQSHPVPQLQKETT